MIVKINGNTSILKLNFHHNFQDENFKIALLSFQSINLIPNFTEKNNKIGNTIIHPGQYTFDLLKKIVPNLKYNDVENKFNLSNEVLDRPRKLYPVENIKIHCNLVEEGMIRPNKHTHEETQIIFCFKINSEFKHPIIHEPTNPIYFSVQHRSISKIEIKICDQDDNLIDFGGAYITIILEIKNFNNFSLIKWKVFLKSIQTASIDVNM